MCSSDLKSYGLKSAGRVVETVLGYVHEQGLSARRVTLEEMFAPQTLDL